MFAYLKKQYKNFQLKKARALRDERIKRRNEEFESMSPKDQRVAIAVDVIESIASKQYIADTGHYIRPSDFNEGDLKSQLPSKVNCEVCAIGACLLSITKYKNQIDKDDISLYAFGNKNSKVLQMLSQLYEPKQLALIECAFEDSPFSYNHTDSVRRVGSRAFGIMLPEEEITECSKFKQEAKNKSNKEGALYYGENAVLVEIMQNIVNNDGEFIPSQLPK